MNDEEDPEDLEPKGLGFGLKRLRGVPKGQVFNPLWVFNQEGVSSLNRV